MALTIGDGKDVLKQSSVQSLSKRQVSVVVSVVQLTERHKNILNRLIEMDK